MEEVIIEFDRVFLLAYKAIGSVTAEQTTANNMGSLSYLNEAEQQCGVKSKGDQKLP